jgi:hypothetical protein
MTVTPLKPETRRRYVIPKGMASKINLADVAVQYLK